MSDKLRGRLSSLANLLYEQPAAVSLGLHTVPDEAIIRIRELEAELSSITDAAGDEDPLALIAAAKKLPVTADKVRVAPGDTVFDANGDSRTVHHDCWGCRVPDEGGYWVAVSHVDWRWKKEHVPGASKDLRVSRCYSTREASAKARGE